MSYQKLSSLTGLSLKVVENICQLIKEGSTIPFIARYRKEMTGGATDEQLRQFEEVYAYAKKLDTRKEEVERLIKEKGRYTDALRDKLSQAETLAQVEDLYRPFKDKKNTRAGQALAKGLLPLANQLQKNDLDEMSFRTEANKFVKGDVSSIEEAIQGAQDILAEHYSDSAKERDILRQSMQRHGLIETKKTKIFEEEGPYKLYAAHTEKVAFIPSHRFLAIQRGVKEKQLSMKISMDQDRLEEAIWKFKIPQHGRNKEMLYEAYKDGLKRLLYPSIEREVLAEVRAKSETQAIQVFGSNLSQLLMTPPTPKAAILGVDPGYRTGCKCAVINGQGKYLDHAVIYPVPPQNDLDGARKVIEVLCQKYSIDAVAIGNGTASRETQDFFADLNRQHGFTLPFTVVSEAGASVYSASKLAQEEHPDLDVTIRGAISIAERLLDPMAALVKIDPKSIGVGQYQHDVDQGKLSQKLDAVVEAIVNQVGVDVNTASAALLSHVAGIGPKVAAEIVAHRDKHGSFKTRQALLKVKGLGQKAFEQCSGFLRIRGGKEILDNTGVHPEHYASTKVLQQNVEIASITLSQMKELSERYQIGLETLRDIIKELSKPGFDPRSELPPIHFRQDVLSLDDLSEGMMVSGVVRNLVDFGAFVDVGLKNDGLIHISEISHDRIQHPMDRLHLNQYLAKLKVIKIDRKTQKIGLSLKS